MPRKMQPSSKIVEADLPFPVEGVDLTRSFIRQRTSTCPDALNVRTFEPITGRARGGSRSGSKKYYPTAISGAPSFQEINHLVTLDGGPPAAGTYGQFPYVRGAGSGFGLSTPAAGASYFTQGTPPSNQSATCSCWDTSNNLYIGLLNASTGATSIYSFTSAGVANWTLPVTSLVANTALRAIAGMVVIGTNLFIAIQTSTGGVIHKLRTDTGAFVAQSWQTFNASTLPINFSTAAHNVLSACGTMLGVDSCGNSGTTAAFRIWDSAAATNAAALVTRLYTGTAANTFAKVVSDGVGFFYGIASVTPNPVFKIGLDGSIQWQSAAINTGTVTPTAIAYDNQNNVLFVTTNVTPFLRGLKLTDGTLLTSSSPGSAAQWDEISGDNQGLFTLYRNSVASNDQAQINYTGAITWGPITRANAVQSGMSVNTGNTGSTGSRQTRLLGVAGGTCYRIDTTSAVAVVNGTNAFSVSAPTVSSTQHGLNLYFVDGLNYKYYNAATNAILAWAATSGTLPKDTAGNTARLICLWNGRLVLSGLLKDPANFFMSKQGNPFIFAYNPVPSAVTDAVAGNASTLGLLGDFITCLMPYRDDTLLIGGDHSLWQLSGDPASGGRFDRISESLGVAWGRPYAIDPYGQIYFFGSDRRIYKMQLGSIPVYISEPIKQNLESINLGTNRVRMVWDGLNQGLAVWITPLDATKPTFNYFLEDRTSAWWPDKYGVPAHNPLAVHVFDGDGPDDRVIMIGGRDGMVRALSNSAKTDDGTPISSFVWLGPIKMKGAEYIKILNTQATLGTASGLITYQVYVGHSAEAAFNSSPAWTGTFSAGHNPADAIWKSGHAVYVKVLATTSWALEKWLCTYEDMGDPLGRMP